MSSIVDNTNALQALLEVVNSLDNLGGSSDSSGSSITITSVTESTADGGVNVITFSDGTTLSIRNGTKGSKGDTGSQGAAGKNGTNGTNGTSVTVKSVSESTVDGGSNVVTFSDGKTITIKNGTKGSTGATGATGSKGDKGDTGATGQRGTGLLPTTSAPTSYTTAVGNITPKYRMEINTIKTQSGVTNIYIGDSVRYNYYVYPIVYLDSSYAYFTTRQSIRGASGAAGTTPARGTDYWTEADIAEIKSYVDEAILGGAW